ncbi:MAG: tetratricopeptide repeat protein [Deltaproteobacteria bacterium]|nr:tetratricopeptide repeat protein [Deltaproteobacteria bacterium]
MRRATRFPLTFLAILAVGAPLPALAQPKPAAPDPPAAPAEPKTKEQLEAQQHFQRAKELYAAGSYREAIAELEAARTLDPKAKDLVFNLGIVHEKLAKYDEAITFFRQYQEMEGVTAAEKTKAETIIKRIEGAKREVPVAPTATPTTTPTTAPPSPPPDPPRGRIDAATITAGSIAILGLGLGATFGILALSNRPGDGTFVTGRDGSYQDLQQKADDAHGQAVVADISLVVGLLAAGATAYLYFGRTKDPESAPSTSQAKRSAWVRLPAPAPLRDGGAIVWGGTFR